MSGRTDRRLKRERRRLRGRLGIKSFRVELTLIIFCLMFLTSVFTVLVYIPLRVMIPALRILDSLATSASTLIACTIIETGAAAIFTKWILAPLNEMIEATERISKGDFKIHIQETFDEKSDFGILQRSFNHMARELDGIEMFRKDFINNFSHEFKTPIVSIQGFAHQLQAGGLTPEEEREYIRIIAAESDRLAKMSTNILLLSKLENQAIVTEQTEFWLDEQLRTCLVLLEKQWGAKGIELNIDLEAVKYRSNEDMLSQLWLNLFSNAIKFTPEGGTVSCILKSSSDHITVQISDTGIGIPESDLTHIFDRFYRVDKARSRETGGTGLGLSIVKQIVNLHDGDITVTSAENQGSTFTITLPLVNK